VNLDIFFLNVFFFHYFLAGSVQLSCSNWNPWCSRECYQRQQSKLGYVLLYWAVFKFSGFMVSFGFFFFFKFWNLFFNFFLGDCKAPEWKKLSSKELGLSNSLISMPTKKVLNGLKKNGIVLGHNELFCICGFSLFCWRWKET
jgi:hypothetical protein